MGALAHQGALITPASTPRRFPIMRCPPVRGHHHRQLRLCGPGSRISGTLTRWTESVPRRPHSGSPGAVRSLGHGLFHAPRRSRFGEVPPSDEALLDAFLDGTPYVVTGPMQWNALGLGSTALHVRPLVYNTKRTGTFDIGGRAFELRRTAFPTEPTPEWFVVDLLRNADAAGTDRADLLRNLAVLVAEGRFDRDRLLQVATRFGRREEVARIREALERS